MAELSFTEKNESLVAVLLAGKEIYQQVKQQNSATFTANVLQRYQVRHLHEISAKRSWHKSYSVFLRLDVFSDTLSISEIDTQQKPNERNPLSCSFRIRNFGRPQLPLSFKFSCGHFPLSLHVPLCFEMP